MKIKLHWQILLGIIAGICFGIFLPGKVNYIEWIGVLFMRSLKMIVIPLVLTSLITGVANIGSSSGIGRLGIKTIMYYLITSILALLTGLIFVNIIHPGKVGSIEIPGEHSFEAGKSLYDTIINIIPTNIFQSLQSNNQMLSIIFIALLIGIFIIKLPSKQKTLLQTFFSALFELMMKITNFIMLIAPIGIFSLIAKSITTQNDLFLLIESLGRFTLTCITALLFHFFITLPLILFLFGKINPLQHFKAMIVPLITAFSTASSNATLPLTIQEIEIKSKVSNKISSFTLPLGATINMDGTGLYELVVAIFISQLMGVELSFTQQFVIITTALLSSIGAAGIPMASLTTMTIIFTSVGLPLNAIAIVLPVDRILDMCRTATNVWSDTCGAVIIAKSENENIYS